nr:MAPEG family protein [Deltaproteobacteria bacterium]
MTTAYWCVLIAGLLPYLAATVAKAGVKFDNNNPRDWLAKQEGWRRRANAAQSNGFEALPFFAAAVIVAHLAHAPQGRIDTLALGFIAARVAHFAAYLADVAPLRSLVWMAGLGCTIALFFQGV